MADEGALASREAPHAAHTENVDDVRTLVHEYRPRTDPPEA